MKHREDPYRRPRDTGTRKSHGSNVSFHSWRSLRERGYTGCRGNPASETQQARSWVALSWASLRSHVPCACCQGMPKHCRPSAQGGRGLPWYPSLQQGQVVLEVLETPANGSTVSHPLSLSGPFPCQPPPGPRQTYLSARQTLGSRFPLQVRKGRLGHTCPSQPAPLANLVWGGLSASPQKSTPRRL